MGIPTVPLVHKWAQSSVCILYVRIDAAQKLLGWFLVGIHYVLALPSFCSCLTPIPSTGSILSNFLTKKITEQIRCKATGKFRAVATQGRWDTRKYQTDSSEWLVYLAPAARSGSALRSSQHIILIQHLISLGVFICSANIDRAKRLSGTFPG